MRPKKPETATRTACPYCGVGCGVLATARTDGGADIKGDPDHPANFGRLCSKGTALGETVSLEGRLHYPEIRGTRTSWDEALKSVATRFSETIAAHGPDSVAFYVSGQLLTEDYYVANKLMKGFIGSANIDTNSRLCMASSVAGHKRAFGSDTVPGTYEDLELADLVVLVGSNLAWCHPVLFQRLAAAKEARGTKIVVIDPRATATCEIADMHLAIRPGSDVALFNGLLTHIDGASAIDHQFVERHTSGAGGVLRTAREHSFSRIAEITGLSQLELFRFYDHFVETERTVTAFSQGVNQSSSGTDKVNAIINCHLATGRIGRPGMGPFSITGQPNAMGGREVGGLANMLAAHMELADPEHRRIVQSFWKAPRIASEPGLKAVDMFRAVADGRIKAIWVMATNPVDSMPDADAVKAALQACPFVVVSDVIADTDTAALAHVLLPSLAWGEKDGTVTNSERRISRQRPFLTPPGQAKPDWWQLAEVAKRMGFADAFGFSGPSQIFAEHALLSGLENDGRRDFDISRYADITAAEYNALAPTQWPQPAASSAPSTRFFANGGFFTPNRRANFIATPFRGLATAPTPEYPFVLNTGRIRDQWHTMTRTGRAARLFSHYAEPFAEIHPDDASRLGLTDASLVEIKNAGGRIVVRTLITPRQQRGSVFVPMHWTDQFASAGRMGALSSAATDPVSGQPELKAAPVAVSPFAASWHGFALCRDKPKVIDADYWAFAPAKSGWRIELAGSSLPGRWETYARRLFDAMPHQEIATYSDPASSQFRAAVFDGERLIGALFVSPQPVAVSRSDYSAKLASNFATASDCMQLLAGRNGSAQPDRGPIVCACFEIGLNEIAAAVTDGRCMSVTAVGDALKAGTNCGSCRPEIGRIINERTLAKAG
jgi:assimilatory nitrate reductase catalytic subunit